MACNQWREATDWHLAGQLGLPAPTETRISSLLDVLAFQVSLDATITSLVKGQNVHFCGRQSSVCHWHQVAKDMERSQ